MAEVTLRSNAETGLQPGLAARRSPIAAPSSMRAAAASDIQRTVGVIALAFGKDPVARWMYPDPHQYLACFPLFVTAFAGRAFEYATAHQVGDFSGAALWLPPGVQPDEAALVQVLQQTLSAEVQDEVWAVFEQLERCHPSGPHWYLPLIGVDPARQGQGYGSALLEHALAVCDRDRSLAYLESSSPANIPLYERHGFALLDEIQAGGSPPLYPMLREPR